jgi:lysozyme family protein
MVPVRSRTRAQAIDMIDLAKQKAIELGRWNAASVLPSRVQFIDEISHNLVAAKPRYQSVEAQTGVPWSVIAAIHERESSQSWTASLSQGDPWNEKSIHVPKGRGPFKSWEDAAVDALVNCAPQLAKWTDWTIGGALCAFDGYNGEGYWDRGLPSPYIWAATDQYQKGKYTADGHFDPNAVDKQIGVAALLARMSLIDLSIANEWYPT